MVNHERSAQCIKIDKGPDVCMWKEGLARFGNGPIKLNIDPPGGPSPTIKLYELMFTFYFIQI